VVAAASLAAIQSQRFDEPTILVAERVGGDDEPPQARALLFLGFGG
jgi:hypothetical protein